MRKFQAHKEFVFVGDRDNYATPSFSVMWEMVLITIGMAASCYFFYPGCMSGDTWFSWNEAIYRPTPRFYNLHPPLIAYTWRLLNQLPFYFVPRYAVTFVAMNLLYWVGLILAIRPWFNNKYLWIAAFLAVGFFLPNFAILSEPVKDSLMCAALMAAYGSLLRAEREHSRMAFVFGLFCLFLALGFRHNAAFAIFPLTLWAGHIFCQSAPICSWWKKMMASMLILITLLTTNFTTNHLLTANSTYPYQPILAFDLVGISAVTGHVYLPELYNDDKRSFIFPIKGQQIKEKTVSIENIRTIYSYNGTTKIYYYGPGKGLRFLSTKEEVGILEKAWLAAIYQEPLAYLKVRKNLFLATIGVLPNDIWPYFCMLPNDREDKSGPTLPRVYFTNKDTWLFKAVTYLIGIALLLTIACWKLSAFPQHVRILGASGLIYGMSYFFIGVNAETRYLFWLMPVFMLMVINMAFGIITGKYPYIMHNKKDAQK